MAVLLTGAATSMAHYLQRYYLQRYYLQAPLVWAEDAPTEADQRPRPQEQPSPAVAQQQQQSQQDGAGRALYRAPLSAELQVAPHIPNLASIAPPHSHGYRRRRSAGRHTPPRLGLALICTGIGRRADIRLGLDVGGARRRVHAVTL